MNATIKRLRVPILILLAVALIANIICLGIDLKVGNGPNPISSERSRPLHAHLCWSDMDTNAMTNSEAAAYLRKQIDRFSATMAPEMKAAMEKAVAALDAMGALRQVVNLASLETVRIDPDAPAWKGTKYREMWLMLAEVERLMGGQNG